jgi:PKD repeat protein
MQNEMGAKTARKIKRSTALAVLLILLFLSSSVNAITIKQEIYASREEPFSFKFSVYEVGEIRAELMDFDSIFEEQAIVLELPNGEVEEVRRGIEGLPLLLVHEVSEDDISSGSDWKISVITDFGDGNGTIKISYPAEATIPTVSESSPTGEDVLATEKITVEFSEPMDKESAENGFFIDPDISGEFEWEGNTMIFVPYPELNYGTRYLVRIEDASDLEGDKMEGYEWVFWTENVESMSPMAVIYLYPSEIKKGESVLFSGEGSSAQDGDIVSYNWDFGDGYTETGMSMEHTFYGEGYYTITLTVTDDDGLSDTARVIVTVVPFLNIPPTAHINISPNPANSSDIVFFEGYGQDEDGDVVECLLTSPDGRAFSVTGDSIYFEECNVLPGFYSFLVMDDDGLWSEAVNSELVINSSSFPPLPPSFYALAAILLASVIYLAAMRIRGGRRSGRKVPPILGTIGISSDPEGSKIYMDNSSSGISPIKLQNISLGNHTIKFRKFGYHDCEKVVDIKFNQENTVYCELSRLSGMELAIFADRNQIPADGKSKTQITIGIEDKNGIPIPVPEDIAITLDTDMGEIESPVTIAAGQVSTTSVLISSTSSGTATVKAEIDERFKVSIPIQFSAVQGA